jgi:hypothetical protein
MFNKIKKTAIKISNISISSTKSLILAHLSQNLLILIYQNTFAINILYDPKYPLNHCFFIQLSVFE